MSPSGAGGSGRFSTGNETLDRLLGGGIPVGDLLALTAPPETQSELLFRELAAVREMRYVDTSGAPEAELRDRFGDADVDVVATSPEDLLENPGAPLEDLPRESFLVVDAVNGLEAIDDRARYRTFLNRTKECVRERDCVAILHCLTGRAPAEQRTMTLHRADDVWQLEPRYDNREIKYRLLVSKSRYHGALDEPVPLLLTDRIDIDTSWSI